MDNKVKTFQEFLKEKGIDDEKFNGMDAIEAAKLHNEYSVEQTQELKDAIEKVQTQKEVEQIKAVMEQMETNNEAYEALAEEVAELKEKASRTKPIKKTLVEEMKENWDTLKSIAKGDRNKEVVLKALVQRSSITNNDQAFDLPDIGQLATRRIALMEVFPTINISSSRNDNGVIRYYDWNDATIVRAATAIAEGTAFPESTAVWIKRTINIRKIGDTIPITEEFMEDEQMFAAELQKFLEINVKLQEELQIASGDNTGQNLRGMGVSITEFNTTPLLNTIPDASVYDLIVKMSEGITTAGGAKYSPDIVLAHKSVINQMKLKKDADNNYIMPPFVTEGGMIVDGMRVIEANVFGTNEIYVGDRRFATIYAKTGYEMSTGMVGQQFVEDEMTMKVRRRMAFLIREADRGGWSKVTNITTALATLTP